MNIYLTVCRPAEKARLPSIDGSPRVSVHRFCGQLKCCAWSDAHQKVRSFLNRAHGRCVDIFRNVAEMFGTRYMATLLGIAFVMHQVGSSLGAWDGGVIFDRFGSYDLAWHIGVLIGFGAGLIQILAGGPSGGRDRIITQQLAPT